jgi:hypothetical protein
MIMWCRHIRHDWEREEVCKGNYWPTGAGKCEYNR